MERMESNSIESKKFYYNNLFFDYIFNFEKIKNYYSYDYRIIESYKKRQKDLDSEYDKGLKNQVADVLLAYNRKIGCSQQAIENIKSLKDNGALVVIGGQQPGFFTGPIFIIYKILTILKLCEFCQGLLGVKIIPFFWNASDDNNFKEINSINILQNELQKIRLDPSRIKNQTAGARFSNIYFPYEYIKEKINDVINSFSDTEFTVKISDFLTECLNYGIKSDSTINKDNNINKANNANSGEINFSALFSIIISKMFSRYGLVVIDPSEPELKKMAMDLVEYDIDNSPLINDLITGEGQKLTGRGYHAQIIPVETGLNFFSDFNGSRQKISRTDRDSYEFSGKLFNMEQLSAMVKENIADISLNVVLRPIFQDTILPVLCSVCGPGEVSYFAQLNRVYESMNKKMPIIYPRFSATVIENKLKKQMERFNLIPEDFNLDREELLKKVMSRNMDNVDLEQVMNNLGKGIISELEKAKESIQGRGIETGNSFDRINRNLSNEIMVLRKKIYAEYKKNNTHIVENFDKIYLNIFPYNNLQERELSVFNYINKYDFTFIDELYRHFKILDFKHKFIMIS
ncbi:MAG: bacillithiol biosynthesis cysteine-adding enzyme BshC [Actinobacteria bacterium]|nr:bacillithiol biosynthesis cysteine-adding enzyme BshC [Actinomycetota bacterium]